jgi:O-antigen ligase
MPLSRLAFWLLWLLLFIVPWENMLVVVPAVATVGRLVGAFAFAIGVLAIFESGKLRQPCAVHALMGASVIWGAVSVTWTIAPSDTVSLIVTSVQLIALVFLIWQFAPDRRRQAALIQAYSLGTMIAAFYTIFCYFYRSPIHYQRYVPAGFDPNDLGLTMVLGLPMSFYLSLREPRKTLVWLYRLQMLAVSCGVLLTASRGALLAAIVTSIIIPLTFRSWTRRQRRDHLLLGGVTLLAVAAVVPFTSWQRLATFGDEVASGTMNHRKLIWQAGIDLFREQPFHGVGMGGYYAGVEKFLGKPAVGQLVAHNTFLSVLVEQGIVGFAIFFSIFFFLLTSALSRQGLDRGLWLALLGAWAVGVLSLTWEYEKATWFVFGILTARLAATQETSVSRAWVAVNRGGYRLRLGSRSTAGL